MCFPLKPVFTRDKGELPNFIDEPTVGLDPEERARFKNLIRKLSKTKTIVLSTHILSDVEEVADYIILIKEGCLTKFEKIGGKDNE